MLPIILVLTCLSPGWRPPCWVGQWRGTCPSSRPTLTPTAPSPPMQPEHSVKSYFCQLIRCGNIETEQDFIMYCIPPRLPPTEASIVPDSCDQCEGRKGGASASLVAADPGERPWVWLLSLLCCGFYLKAVPNLLQNIWVQLWNYGPPRPWVIWSTWKEESKSKYNQNLLIRTGHRMTHDSWVSFNCHSFQVIFLKIFFVHFLTWVLLHWLTVVRSRERWIVAIIVLNYLLWSKIDAGLT